MKAPAFFAALAGTAAATPTINNLVSRQTTTGSLPVVSVKGNAFFAGDERFYIRGVAYQPGGAADAADPLVDITSLKRDVENFKDLGINTIRVYTVDNSQDHAEGMKILDDAGIYLALDANTPDFSLNRADNSSLYQSYNERYLQSVFSTIDNFAGYSNLLLMFNGNEVINDRTNTNAAPYVKALQRDMKAYMSARGYRNIPVGYAAADVSENVLSQLQYFDCGPDSVRGDFFALNDYSWCDPSSFTISGWDKKVERYSNYGAPIFMAEFGCNTNTRQWGEIAALYSDEMTSVYSGGLAYEYSVEDNGYGLVEIASGEITPNEDFARLKKALAATPEPTGDGGYNSATKASECPATSEDWAVADDKIPAMPAKAQDYFKNGAGSGPGLSKDAVTSQYGGESYSEAMVDPSDSSSNTTSSSGSKSAATGLDISSSMVMLVSAIGGAFLVL